MAGSPDSDIVPFDFISFTEVRFESSDPPSAGVVCDLPPDMLLTVVPFAVVAPSSDAASPAISGVARVSVFELGVGVPRIVAGE